MSSAKLFVDGGGTTTRVALWCDRDSQPAAEREGRSCNPHSVGAARAVDNLSDLVSLVWRERPSAVEVMDSAWLCLSTASSQTALHDFAAALLRTSPLIRAAGDLWLTNDIAPLLVHDGQFADRVVAICGTGTGFCGVNVVKGLSARASGKEYLLADEGGGFDIGLQGLRAIVRQDDGRGPKTRLTELLSTWRGVAVGELFSLVYQSPEPKLLISSFAPQVLLAAQEGDECARAIIAGAADEILAGIRAVAASTDLSNSFDVLLAGSNLAGNHPLLRERVGRLLQETMPEVTLHIMSGSTLTPVAHLARLLPDDQRFQALLRSCLPLVRVATG